MIYSFLRWGGFFSSFDIKCSANSKSNKQWREEKTNYFLLKFLYVLWRASFLSSFLSFLIFFSSKQNTATIRPWMSALADMTDASSPLSLANASTSATICGCRHDDNRPSAMTGKDTWLHKDTKRPRLMTSNLLCIFPSFFWRKKREKKTLRTSPLPGNIKYLYFHQINI